MAETLELALILRRASWQNILLVENLKEPKTNDTYKQQFFSICLYAVDPIIHTMFNSNVLSFPSLSA